MNLFPHLDHDGALLPVQLKVDLPHPVLVHLRRDDSDAVDIPREAIIYCGERTQKLLKPLFKVKLVLMVHCSFSYCACEKHGQDSSQ